MTTEGYGGPLIMPPPQGDKNGITRTSWPPKLAMQQVLGSIEKACLMHKIENDKVHDISLLASDFIHPPHMLAHMWEHAHKHACHVHTYDKKETL